MSNPAEPTSEHSTALEPTKEGIHPEEDETTPEATVHKGGVELERTIGLGRRVRPVRGGRAGRDGRRPRRGRPGESQNSENPARD